jgi:GxxExxY protein
MLHEELTGAIIGVFYHVHHELGFGFLESVYERSMIVGLRKLGLKVERQVRAPVYYEGEVVGDFSADLLVEDRVTVELKACRALDSSHEAQLINHLRATSIEVGLLLHFGPKPVFRRRILTNDRKPYFAVRGPPRPSVVVADEGDGREAGATRG